MLNHELIEYQNLDISTKLLQIYERLGDFVNKCSVYQRDCLIIYSYFTFWKDEILIISWLSICWSSNIVDNRHYDINAECQ